VIEDLSRRFNLGAPALGTTHPKQRAVYKQDQEAIRLREGSYVTDFVHELGHHIHKTMFPRAVNPKTGKSKSRYVSSADFPKAWRQELAQLGKDIYPDRQPNGGYATEGWAEVIRLLITNPQHLKQRAPTVYQDVVSLLVTHHPEVWLSLQDARVRLINATRIAQPDPIDQFIAHDKPGIKERYNPYSLWDWFRTRWTDRYNRLVRMALDLGLDQLPAHINAHIMALRVNGGIGGDMKLITTRGTFDPADPERKPTGKSLESIIEPVVKQIRQWQNYMVARRTLEKRGQGYAVLPSDLRVIDDKGRLVHQTSDAEIRRVIRDYEKAYPAFKKASDEFQEFNRWLVQEYAVHYHLISKEAADTIVAKNLEYITFRHKKTEDALQKTYPKGAQGGFTGATSGIRRFREGKGEQIFPPLESFMVSMQGIVSRARLNSVARVILGVWDEGISGAGRWVVKEPRHSDPFKLTAATLSDQISKQLGIKVSDDGTVTLPTYLKDLTDAQIGELVQSMGGLSAATLWTPSNRTDKDNKEVTVLVNGKPEVYKIQDDQLFDMLEGLTNPAAASTLVQWLGIPQRILRGGATQYKPSFFIPNFIRDLFMAITMTTSDILNIANAPNQLKLRLTGMKQAFLGGNLHDLFLASGADMSGIFGEMWDPRKKQMDFAKMFVKPRWYGLIKGDSGVAVLKDLLKFGPIDRLNRSFELANRLGEFAVVHAQKKSAGAGKAEALAEAGQAAADISIDFQRGGTWSKEINQIVPFFNATVLGTDKMARFIKKNPTKALGTIIAFNIMPSLASMLMNWDNDDYWSKPARMRDRYWYFPTGYDDNGRQTYLRMQKPYGLGAFSILFERNFAMFAGLDPETGETRGDPRAYEGMLMAMINEFRPMLSVPLILPMVEVSAGDQGYSFWRQNEIVSAGDKDLPLGEQGATRSSEVARLLGRWWDYPPAKIDYMIQGLTGGLGRDVVQFAVDPVVSVVDPEAKTGEPLDFSDYLIVRRFTASSTRGGHEAVTRFYDDYDHLKRINRGLKSRERDPEKYDTYLRRHEAEFSLWQTYSGAHRRMGQLFGQLRKVYRNRDTYDADSLDSTVDDIYEQIIGTARETHMIRRSTEER